MRQSVVPRSLLPRIARLRIRNTCPLVSVLRETMIEQLAFWELLLRLAAPTAFGALLGWERESADKPAGLRTHMLVGLGASCFTLVGLSLFHQVADGELGEGMDPIRVVEGVATGIGFLGAGTILKKGDDSKGLTTAAGVWAVGAIGAACGAGFYALAAATAAAGVLILLARRLVD